MWNGNNNFQHPGEQQQQAAQQQEALRRRLSLELAAAAYSGGNPGAVLGAAGHFEDHHLALAVAARQQAALEEEQRRAAAAQQQQLELMALHRHQQALAAQELQRRASDAGSAAAAAAVQAVASAVASEFEETPSKKPKEAKKKEKKKPPSESKKAAPKKAESTKPEDAPTETSKEEPRSPSPQPPPQEEEKESPPPPVKPVVPQPRGKPEAMAKKLASAVRRQEILEELEAEEELRQKTKEQESKLESLGTHSAEPKKAAATKGASKKRKKPDTATKQSPAKKKKPPPKKKTPPPKKAASRKSGESKKAAGALLSFGNGKMPTMDDSVEPITEIEYGKLEALMEQFCRVPLLAEFSRPVALLHPELMNAYNKIVDHPIDLGKVCRRIRRRQYENLRDVRLDAWRIFANCFKYHSHPSNKDAVPSFVSIALHLRELFNDLWQEHLLPSDFPPPAPAATGRSKPQDPNAAIRAAMEQRAEDRKKRLVVSGLSVMAGNCLVRAADALHDIIENGGLVDSLDTKPIWGDGVVMDDDDEGDLEVVLENFRKLESSLREIIANNEELGVDELESSCKKCYTEGEGLENMSATLKIRIASRMERYLGQLVVPIHEATCRGVSQSSIWGCMAAAVWARESRKKPFWPALVLGIIAPDDQKEDWHRFLTERNEARLPEKLKSQLGVGKRKAEKAVKRQSLGQADPQSFFLVEFLGSHEFIWVRESDIIENFKPEEDPNRRDTEPPFLNKNKLPRKILMATISSKMYHNALEEAQWALEEFELQLQDIGAEEEEQHEEEGYSYSVLCQSDDEADGETDDEECTSEYLDQDECNELLATNGLLDFSVAGRKRRAQILKQQKLNAEKKQKTVKAKKARADKAKKAKDEKQKEKEKRQEKRDLEKKRRKRMREREKALKGVQHQKKKRKLSDPAPGRRHQIVSKRERAEAIVGGYVSRAAEKGDYKPLGLGGDQRWIQSALIDSTNLSGMALAFRAAAGLIPMPKQDTGAPGKIVLKPWDKIRVKGKKTCAERTALLHQQIDLLEKETKLRKASRLRRLKRLKEVEEELAKMKASILEDDKLARENPLKKSKKPHPLAGKKRKRPGTANVKTEKADSEKNAEAEATEKSSEEASAKASEEAPAEPSIKEEEVEEEETQPKLEEALVS